MAIWRNNGIKMVINIENINNEMKAA